MILSVTSSFMRTKFIRVPLITGLIRMFWDWRSWARPLLDLHQKRHILMFQSPLSASKTLQPYLSGQKVASRLRLDH